MWKLGKRVFDVLNLQSFNEGTLKCHISAKHYNPAAQPKAAVVNK